VRFDLPGHRVVALAHEALDDFRLAHLPAELGEDGDVDPHAIRSVSTSTPSQSKITSEMGALTGEPAARVEDRSVLAAELAVIPRHDAGRREAQQYPFGRLLHDAGARLGRQLDAGVAGHHPHAELTNPLGIALDRDVALEHRSAQLAVHVAAGLDL
jgi:hypothetical protein